MYRQTTIILIALVLSHSQAHALYEEVVELTPASGSGLVKLNNKPVIPVSEQVADDVLNIWRKARGRTLNCLAKYYESASMSGHMALYSIRDCR